MCCGLGENCCLTEAHLVLGEDPEAVDVAHDEVGDGGVEPVVVFQYSEPVLKWDHSLTLTWRGLFSV